MLILGQGALTRADGAAVLHLARSWPGYGLVGEGWNGFNVLHTAAARVGGLSSLPAAGRARHRASGLVLPRAVRLPLLGVDGRYGGEPGKASSPTSRRRRCPSRRCRLPGAAYTEKDAPETRKAAPNWACAPSPVGRA
jgi:NADH-quinone oxidoreductase subunit G